jgi:WD40 repeat protein
MKLAYEKSLTLTGHTKAITSVAFHSGGQILASGAKDHSIRIWNLTSAIGNLQHCYYHHSSALCLTWISDTVHCGFEDGYLLGITLDDITKVCYQQILDAFFVAINDMTEQQLTAQAFKAHTSPLEFIASREDGQFLATGGRDEVRIWRLKDTNG